jgi:hypothetical protein
VLTAPMVVPTLHATRASQAKPEIGNRLNRSGRRGMQPNPAIRNDLDSFGNPQASRGPAIYSENKSVQPWAEAILGDVEAVNSLTL